MGAVLLALKAVTRSHCADSEREPSTETLVAVTREAILALTLEAAQSIDTVRLLADSTVVPRLIAFVYICEL